MSPPTATQSANHEAWRSQPRANDGKFGPKAAAAAPAGARPMGGAAGTPPGDHAMQFPGLLDPEKGQPTKQAIKSQAAFDAALALADRLPSYDDRPTNDLWAKDSDVLVEVKNATADTPAGDLVCMGIRDGWSVTRLNSGFWDECHEDIQVGMDHNAREAMKLRMRSLPPSSGSSIDYSRDPAVAADLLSESYGAARQAVEEAHAAAFAKSMSELPNVAAALGTDDPYQVHCRMASAIDSGAFTQWLRDTRNADSVQVDEWMQFCDNSRTGDDNWDIWKDEEEDRHRY